jgi:hypothetical protein
LSNEIWAAAKTVRVTAVYAVALVAVSATLTVLGPHTRDVVVRDMSTNLHNLSHGRVFTLIGSAFVEAGDGVYASLPGLVCLLALGELICRGSGLIIAFLAGHVGATVLVAAWLVAAVQAGWVPIAVTQATDVGVSYGVMGVLGALTASIPSRWRPTWIGWWLGTAVLVAIWADFEFTGIGHVLALLLGMGLSFRLRTLARWTPLHLGLLAVGASYGYFSMCGPSPLAAIGGLGGALIAQLVNRVLAMSRTRNQPCVTAMP